MSAVAPTAHTSPSLNRSQESSRQSSGNISSRGTPVSSTEGEDDDDEDEDDEEEDDDEEVEEEEKDDSASVRFDEKFLAQLLSFDPSLALQPDAGSSVPQPSSSLPGQLPPSTNGNDLALSAASWPFNIPQSAPVPSQTAIDASATSFIPLSAPTPSNEFYDGAINFLTEILGSSSSSNIWNGGAGANSPGTIDLSWLDQAKTPAGSNALAAPNSQANKSQFKHLQPLISNLIARLKGHPVEEGMQSGKSLEDDLVVLLQNLMAHRQAQQDRQAHQHQIGVNMPVVNQSEAQASQSNLSVPLPSQPAAAPMTATSTFANPGFSIVDFDFGDDDDDPDFIPNSLGFASSAELNDVLAKASEGTMQPMNNLHPKEGQDVVNEATWQQMMQSLQHHAGTTSTAGTSSLPVPSDSPGRMEGEYRRTRSISRNVDLAQSSFDTRALDDASPQQDESDTQSYRGDNDNDTQTKKKGRRPLDREEALERRRISNRECAKRGRAKKKQEEEEIRIEFERMRKMRSVSRDVIASTSRGDITDEDLPAGLRKKKKGRPAGSKSTLEKTSMNQDEVADLKADNRMLRAEMQRLIEENTQLRVSMLHLEERGLKRDRSGEVRSRRGDNRGGGRESGRACNTRARAVEARVHTDDEDDDFDELGVNDPEDDDAGFLRQSLASRSLSFDPFKRFQPPTSMARDQGRRSNRAANVQTKTTESFNEQARRAGYKSIEHLLKDVSNQECPAKQKSMINSASMQEIIQRAAQAGLV